MATIVINEGQRTRNRRGGKGRKRGGTFAGGASQPRKWVLTLEGEDQTMLQEYGRKAIQMNPDLKVRGAGLTNEDYKSSIVESAH